MRDSSIPTGLLNRLRKGQSLVEVAMLLPILLIILSGVLEFGFMFTHYLAALDATRNAARFSSDNQFDAGADGIKDCNTTTDFYRSTACLVLTELIAEEPTISLCLPNSFVGKHCPRVFGATDDVIISVISIHRDGTTGTYPVLKRFPEGVNEGWSFATDIIDQSQNTGVFARSGKHVSRFSNSDIVNLLDPAAPNTGIVIVEVMYSYWQNLALPWFTAFVPDPVEYHLYAIWPLVSAEPTPTPRP